MTQVLLILSIVLNLVILVLLVTKGSGRAMPPTLASQLTQVEQGQVRLEQSLRGEMAQNREETGKTARMNRAEMNESVHRLSQSLLSNMEGMAEQQKRLLDSFATQLSNLTHLNEIKLEELRQTVEQKLTLLQTDNSKKLEQMRATVDEKLNDTLEKRLGESFKMVSDRLEQVHKGLGEMQSLAAGVGDLKKVLTNVKTRGTLGEIQLENILEQTLTMDQYDKNVATSPGSAERVEFAIRLPGKDSLDSPVWLPIDSKFPTEDYQRLVDAQEAGDIQSAAEAAKLLEMRIKQEAKTIHEKYVNPPHTTDFALLFLPTEGLFAEVLRRPGLWESLQRDFRVVVAGPTTVTALLNSLQMGFRTLAIQHRSSEVWQLLGAVKTEFSKFAAIMEKTQKKLQEASNTIDDAAKRTRAIERKLRSVEELPAVETGQVLGELDLVGQD
ncbi:DNA recombination protein RmuC [Alicyclobacillaceae bacterium I2511]|nr:DNA recombination protein RmuC [Alicyclobacillaceae bacterium I2511]